MHTALSGRRQAETDKALFFLVAVIVYQSRQVVKPAFFDVHSRHGVRVSLSFWRQTGGCLQRQS
jgi:hypothetical protein